MDNALWPRVREQLQAYRIRADRAVPVAKGAYRLEGATRTYDVRVVPHQDADQRIWAGDAAAAGGMMRVERALKNNYGERMVPFSDDDCLYVTAIWTGEALGVTPSGVKLAGTTLAQLHRALAEQVAKAESGSEMKLQNRYGSWPASFRRAREMFERERQSAKDRVDGNLLNRYQDVIDGLLSSAEQSLDVMEANGYDALAEAAAERRETAWNGLTFAHLIRLPSGHVGVLQTQTPAADLCMYDLACLARQIVEAGYADGVEDLIDAYDAVRPLIQSEKNMVRAYAGFPHIGLQLVRQVRRGQDVLDLWDEVLQQRQQAADELFQRLE